MHGSPRARPRVAFATCAAEPGLHGEEQELLPRLRARGVDADAAVWTDPAIDWSRYGAVVVRSTWDYFQRFAEFEAWLGRVDSLTRLWNPASLVRWNYDKRYLRDLASRGISTVPTVFLEPGASANLARVLGDAGWERAVLKPAVSGGAFRTHRVSIADAAAHQPALDEILASTCALVQPFVPEIETAGEHSLFFFDGAFSHAVVKRPAAGDYRIQPQFGGTKERVAPEPWLLEQAKRVLAALPEAPAYARIDGICRGKELLLMEAELIEPYLFFAAAPDAMDGYVQLVERLARAR